MRIALLALVLVGCAPFAPAEDCEIDGATWHVAEGGQGCAYFARVTAAALEEGGRLGVRAELKAGLSGADIWVRSEEAFRCGLADGFEGCSSPTATGAHIELGPRGGALLHELFHVVDWRRGAVLSAAHVGWGARGWTAAGDSFSSYWSAP